MIYYENDGPFCALCGAELVRIRRNGWTRLWYVALFRCRQCERDIGFGRWRRFSIHCHCPKCGNEKLTRLRKRDRIELMYRNPISFFQKFVGAPLWHCEPCRLQFYDLRRPRRSRPAKSEATV